MGENCILPTPMFCSVRTGSLGETRVKYTHASLVNPHITCRENLQHRKLEHCDCLRAVSATYRFHCGNHRCSFHEPPSVKILLLPPKLDMTHNTADNIRDLQWQLIQFRCHDKRTQTQYNFDEKRSKQHNTDQTAMTRSFVARLPANKNLTQFVELLNTRNGSNACKNKLFLFSND